MSQMLGDRGGAVMERVLAVIKDHPTWTVGQIAAAADTCRSYVARVARRHGLVLPKGVPGCPRQSPQTRAELAEMQRRRNAAMAPEERQAINARISESMKRARSGYYGYRPPPEHAPMYADLVRKLGRSEAKRLVEAHVALLARRQQATGASK
jgi:hypothetical protein